MGRPPSRAESRGVLTGAVVVGGIGSGGAGRLTRIGTVGGGSSKLHDWAKVSDAKRPAALEKAWAARFDAKAAGERLRPWRRWRWVVFLANLGLFTALFGGWGLLSFAERPPPFVLLLLLMLLAWWVAIAATVLAIRRVLPKDARPTRFQYVLTLLSPLSLLRSPVAPARRCDSRIDDRAPDRALEPRVVRSRFRT